MKSIIRNLCKSNLNITRTSQCVHYRTLCRQPLKGYASPSIYSIGTRRSRTNRLQSLSLIQTMQTSMYSTEVADVFVAARRLMGEKKYDAAITSMQETLESAKKSNDKVSEMQSLDLLGLIAMELADYDAAERLLAAALATGKAAGARRFEAKVLLELATVYGRTGESLKMSEHVDEAISVARAEGDWEMEAMANKVMARLCMPSDANKGNVDAAVKHYQRALSLYKQHKNEAGITEVSLMLAQTHSMAGDFDASNRLYDDLILQYEAPGKSHMAQFYAFKGLGDNYAKMQNQHKMAVSNYREACTIAREHEQPQQEIAVLYNMAVVQFAADLVDDALQSAAQLKELAVELESSAWEARALMLQAQLLESSDGNEAMARLRDALDVAERAGDAHAATRIRLQIGNVYSEKLNDNDAALNAYTTALRHAETDKDYTTAREALLHIANIYQNEMGDHEAAVASLERALVLNEKGGDESIQRLRIFMSAMPSYAALGQNEKSRDTLSKALAIAQTLQKQGVLTELPVQLRELMREFGVDAEQQQRSGVSK